MTHQAPRVTSDLSVLPLHLLLALDNGLQAWERQPSAYLQQAHAPRLPPCCGKVMEQTFPLTLMCYHGAVFRARRPSLTLFRSPLYCLQPGFCFHSPAPHSIQRHREKLPWMAYFRP